MSIAMSTVLLFFIDEAFLRCCMMVVSARTIATMNRIPFSNAKL